MVRVLSDTHPELAREAFGWDPTKVAEGSAKKLPWKCAIGHEWIAEVRNRTGVRGSRTSCPVCSSVGYLFPALAKEAVGWDPMLISASNNAKLKWKCDKGHEWLAVVGNRTRGSGCPTCSGRQVLIGFNDLATLKPELAAEAFEWDPSTVTLGSIKSKKWICKEGHQWEAVVSTRMKNGCPTCGNFTVLQGYNDLATTHPELAKEAHGWDPTKFRAHSGKKVSWLCTLGHHWDATIGNRTKGGGCPVCSGQQVLIGFNDLATTHPEIAIHAHGWDPKTVVAGSTKKMRWECPVGHVTSSRVYSKTRHGNGCAICANQELLIGYNDLETLFPKIAQQAHGWDPRNIIGGGGRNRAEWICDFGHIWESSIASRTRSKSAGCPICGNDKILVGYNDLKTTHPIIASEADGWDPTKLMAGSDKKMAWKCSENHQWTSAVSIRTRPSGCPTCASSGFDPNSKAWLYFLEHSEWQLYQIGITNFPNKRVKLHQNRGWEVKDLRGPMDGLLARNWEISILEALKKRGAIFSPSAAVGKFDGYTEAWGKLDFIAHSLKDLMKLVELDEANDDAK